MPDRGIFLEFSYTCIPIALFEHYNLEIYICFLRENV